MLVHCLDIMSTHTMPIFGDAVTTFPNNYITACLKGMLAPYHNGSRFLLLLHTPVACDACRHSFCHGFCTHLYKFDQNLIGLPLFSITSSFKTKSIRRQ